MLVINKQKLFLKNETCYKDRKCSLEEEPGKLSEGSPWIRRHTVEESFQAGAEQSPLPEGLGRWG